MSMYRLLLPIITRSVACFLKAQGNRTETLFQWSFTTDPLCSLYILTAYKSSLKLPLIITLFLLLTDLSLHLEVNSSPLPQWRGWALSWIKFGKHDPGVFIQELAGYRCSSVSVHVHKYIINTNTHTYKRMCTCVYNSWILSILTSITGSDSLNWTLFDGIAVFLHEQTTL